MNLIDENKFLQLWRTKIGKIRLHTQKRRKTEQKKSPTRRPRMDMSHAEYAEYAEPAGR